MQTVGLWVSCAAFGLSLAAFWLAARAFLGSEERSPARWSIRLGEVADQLTDLTDRVDNLAETMRKASARRAGRARLEKSGEPDPYKDPEAWKAFVNARLVKGNKGAE